MAFVSLTSLSVRKQTHINVRQVTYKTQVKTFENLRIACSISSFDEPDIRKLTFQSSENYEKRNFAIPLQKAWSGELATTGAWERPISTSFREEVMVTPESSEAFGRLQRDLASERRESLRRLEEDKRKPRQGRPTCGPEEGVGVFSNGSDFGSSKIKCLEYWGRPGRMFQE
ncbi:hypothetical protein GpartN1_g221.t1 [Galdieria partita]|uniref:Uncharacterized protein n=1 Tax=Galdieria partita TaxID=83374 RepID=A0A9C7PQ54_9RHOD|nr:hypothetical protein GpartN1_g221.t1 [Galdieria partita]